MAFAFYFKALPKPRPTKRLLTNHHRKRGTSVITLRCLVDSLQEALEKGYVQPFGSKIILDKNGFFPQQETPVLPSEHVNVLGDVAPIVKAILGDRNVCAIFVRGSIVAGNLLQYFRSDLDLIIFTQRAVRPHKKYCLQERLLSNLRNTLKLRSIDIQYLHKEEGRNVKGQFRVSPTLRIILHHFAVPIYGSREDIGDAITGGLLKTSPDLSINIRNDMNTFLRIVRHGAIDEHFSVGLSAIQWLCKKCLRAAAELAALKTRAYARDLLPCYQLASVAFPAFAITMLHGLQIACASPPNRYLGMQKSDILRTGTSVALQFAEIVEELSIRHCFGKECLLFSESSAAIPSGIITRSRRTNHILKEFQQRLRASFCSYKKRISIDTATFRTWSLPTLELKGSSFVQEKVMNVRKATCGDAPAFADVFDKVSEPLVYRARMHDQLDGEASTRRVLQLLLGSTSSVQCRVSRGREVMFCRSQHKWIEERIFTPPSVLVSMPVAEALQRLGHHELPGILSDDCDDECIYIQSKVIPNLRVFEHSGSHQWEVAQEERLWISSHGTVSTLHYDASHSALYQRCGRKRLLFFPPCCLPQLGMFPLGHPLHRRARVDLTRKDTVVFQQFWSHCASKAMEVTLEAGDLLLIPPYWAHYTETITGSIREMSISHTFRYAYR